MRKRKCYKKNAKEEEEEQEQEKEANAERIYGKWASAKQACVKHDAYKYHHLHIRHACSHAFHLLNI